MPEGDTLARIAAGLRPVLVGQPVTAARARLPGPNVDHVVGRTITTYWCPACQPASATGGPAARRS
jgi:formamidopyrimidine-DNA glycosylase